jgi:transcriptional regulator with XRE-family HTH domain
MAERSSHRDCSKMARFIRSRREELGMTQQDLADRIGVKSRNFIVLLEGDRVPFPPMRWGDFARALELDQYEFLASVFEHVFPGLFGAMCSEEFIDALRARIKDTPPTLQGFQAENPT